MHPRPEWFNLLKNAVLRLIVCIGVITFTYSGYIFPFVWTQIKVDMSSSYPGPGSRPMLDTVMSFIVTVCLVPGLLAFGLSFLAVQYELVTWEHKLGCGICMLLNILPAYWSIAIAVGSGPTVLLGQVWNKWIVGQCYGWLFALLTGLLVIAMVIYWLALLWLDYEAQSSGGTDDGQPVEVVIHGEGVLATPGATSSQEHHHHQSNEP